MMQPEILSGQMYTGSQKEAAFCRNDPKQAGAAVCLAAGRNLW